MKLIPFNKNLYQLSQCEKKYSFLDYVIFRITSSLTTSNQMGLSLPRMGRKVDSEFQHLLLTPRLCYWEKNTPKSATFWRFHQRPNDLWNYLLANREGSEFSKSASGSLNKQWNTNSKEILPLSTVATCLDLPRTIPDHSCYPGISYVLGFVLDFSLINEVLLVIVTFLKSRMDLIDLHFVLLASATVFV